MTELHDVLGEIEEWVLDRALTPNVENVSRAVESSNLILSSPQVDEAARVLQSRLLGYGEIESLVELRPTDIVVNSPDSVWFDIGDGLQQADVQFESELAVRRLAMRLAHSVHRRLDDAQPFVDALLADGARLHAVIPPLSAGSTCISLRFPRAIVSSLADWFVDTQLYDAFQDAVANQRSLVISGATGAGKTTLIRSLVDCAYRDRRVVVVEDVAELNMAQPNVVSLQTRHANSDGVGAISLRALVRQTLRMRPDSIIVGEMRGEEAIDWLLAVSSGHRGSLTTIHAADVTEAQQRLRLLCALGNISQTAIDGLLSAQDLVFVHCEKVGHRRLVTQVVDSS